MRVSIVTPSFNQAAFLEQTMLSVFNQSYKDIEYFVIDGGSTDVSADIIRKYSLKLAYWQSKQDRGMADAVNQGWKRATGEILSYLNSDDYLEEHAVEKIVSAFQRNPNVYVVYGDSKVIDADGRFLYDFPSEPFDLKSIFKTWSNPLRQPSTFIRRDAYNKVGGLDESFHFCLDLEYWLRIAQEGQFFHLPETVSYIRLHDQSKTATQEDIQARELIRIYEKVKGSDLQERSGVSERDALTGLYLRVSEHFLNAGKKSEALRAFFHYCRLAFNPFTRAYRFSRFAARVLLRA